jgi:protein SCO1/2
MHKTPLKKAVLLLLAIFIVIVTSFSFAVWHHEDGDNRVKFQLINHKGEYVTQEDLGGRHLFVFFGFTSCHEICPTQMAKITQAMAQLDKSGRGDLIRPVFISVDPERDTPEKIANFLLYFDHRFVGLTGSRSALETAADSFKTLFAQHPNTSEENYQVTHSSVTYIIDPFGRMVAYVPSTVDAATLADSFLQIL